MTELFLRVVNLSYHAVWIVLAVILLRLLLQKAPKWTFVLLWALVAVRLLVPVSVESPVSLQPSAQIIPTNVMEAEEPVIHTGLPAVNYAVGQALDGNKVANNKNYVNPIQRWLPVLSIVWLCGAAIMAGYSVISSLLLKRKLSGAVPLQQNIYRSSAAPSPFVLGIFRPKIYLPENVTEADCSHVIAHEQAHIQRKDHWWKPLGFLLLTIHWFNPMLWLAYVLLCRDLELACDEKVVRELGELQRADYSQALLNCSISRRRIAACPLAFGGVGVGTRIRNVLTYKKPALWIIVIVLLAAAITAVCLLTVPEKWEKTPETGRFSVGEPRYSAEKAYVQTVGISEEKQLWIDGVYMGDLEPLVLSAEELKDYAARKDSWQKSYRLGQVEEAEILRMPDIGDKFYLVVRTSRGELLLGYGWEDVSERGQGASDDTSLDWLCSLTYTDIFRLPTNRQWVDYTHNPAAMTESETTVPEFPDTIFRYTPGQVTVVKDGVETELITGMPIWSVFFTNLTGDQYPEVCAAVSFGSGMIDNHIVVCDLADGETYSLWDRGEFDYTLSMEDDVLICEKRVYPNGELVKRGPLAMGVGSFVPWTLGIADMRMVPTAANLRGVLDNFLFLKGADGQNYRYQRAAVYGETLTQGELLDSFIEYAEPENVQWQVFAFQEIPDHSSVLAVADGVYPFRYDYAPPQALDAGVLQQAADRGCAVMVDGTAADGQEIWQAFYDAVQTGEPASVQIARWFTLDPAHCDAAYYAANREDYPAMQIVELTYDGDVYHLRREENGEISERKYAYLMRYERVRASTVSSEEPETMIEYVLTNDNTLTWEEIWYSLFSSALVERIDHYFLWTEEA